MTRMNLSVLLCVTGVSVGCTAGTDIGPMAAELTRPGDCICLDVYDPVCGIDGNTYSNACRAQCAGTKVAFKGTCDQAPTEEVTWFKSCDFIYGLSPFPSEDGHLGAVRIPILGAPFKVEQIEFSMIGPNGIPTCDDTLPIEISVWKQNTAFPDERLFPLYRTTYVPEPTPGAPNSFFTIDLPFPFVANEGESVYVAFRADYVPETGTSTCVASCWPPDQVPAVGFWSNSATAPFPWADLNDFGIWGAPIVRLYGPRLEGSGDGPPAF